MLESRMSHTSHAPSSRQTSAVVCSLQAVESMAWVPVSEDNNFSDSTMSANPWEEELQKREESSKLEEEEARGREEEQEERIQRGQVLLPPKRTIPSTHNERKPQPRKGITLIFVSVDQQIDLLEKQLNNVQGEFLRVQDLVAGVRSTVANLKKPEAIKLVEVDASTNYQRIGDRLKAIANEIAMIMPDHERSVDGTPTNLINGSDLEDAYSEPTNSVPLALPAPPISYDTRRYEAKLASSASALSDKSDNDSEWTISPKADVHMPGEFVILSRSRHRQRNPIIVEEYHINEQLLRRRQTRRGLHTEGMRAPRQSDRGRDDRRRSTERRSWVNYPSETSMSGISTYSKGFDHYEPRRSSDYEDDFLSYSRYHDREEVHRPRRHPRQWGHPYPEDIDHRVKATQRPQERYQVPPNPESSSSSSIGVPASFQSLSNQPPSNLSEAGPFISRESLTQEERQKDVMTPRVVLVEPKDYQMSSLEGILQEKQTLLLEMLDEVQIRLQIMQNRQTSKSRRDERELDDDNLKGNLWNRLKSKVVDHRKKKDEFGVTK